MESDQEEQTGRKIVTPARYLDSGNRLFDTSLSFVACPHFQKNILRYAVHAYLILDTDMDEPLAKRIKQKTATSATMDQTPQMPAMPSCK